MMPKKLPKGVTVDRDRHKNVRLYFRAPGRPKIRLREQPGTKAFDDEVACARIGIPYEKKTAPAPRKPGAAAKENSFHWLVQQYKQRAKNRLNPDQLARRVRLLEEICESGKKRRGDLPYKLMERKHVLEIRDTIRDTAGAQNNVVKTVSAMFGWAISVGLADRNPAIGIEHLHSGDGFHAWTVDEVRQYEERHPQGSKARLALHLGLFTGLRLSDLATLGKQHIRDGWLYVRPGKTGKSSGVVVEIPVLAELQATIEATETGDLTFLITDLGRPFTVNGLGNKMRQWCDQAGLPQCSMHGLRKAGATIAADNGATDSQLMAIFGWTTKKQTTLYTKKADRKRLAGEAIRKLVPEQKTDETVPPQKGLLESGTKIAKKAIKSNT
ncbi:tyrosine-type recombinase/integrase [Amaricoccus sp.]|uniref:tyrosine-type recombinase/integrase n=1 Tax=Amaricoccus sp. TaxID=1872485 RepID=UPI00263A2232|nr:tyrosine-type recombinase/integrase [Amaricoccus sp.]HMQ95532.1 tyrosine-type recombinase/integrase [Amaricoccus sp.]